MLLSGSKAARCGQGARVADGPANEEERRALRRYRAGRRGLSGSKREEGWFLNRYRGLAPTRRASNRPIPRSLLTLRRRPQQVRNLSRQHQNPLHRYHHPHYAPLQHQSPPRRPLCRPTLAPPLPLASPPRLRLSPQVEHPLPQYPQHPTQLPGPPAPPLPLLPALDLILRRRSRSGNEQSTSRADWRSCSRRNGRRRLLRVQLAEERV